MNPLTVANQTMQPPAFASSYFPSTQDLTSKQYAFYHYLVEEIAQGKYPAVAGNIGYLFIYAYSILRKWKETGFAGLHDSLLDLAEAYYAEKKFSSYCQHWAYDCLLSAKAYEEYLSLTEPTDLFATATHRANMRCNVQRLLGWELRAADLVNLVGGQVTNYTREHSTAFREEAKRSGPWHVRALASQNPPRIYEHYLLAGAPIDHPKVRFPYYCFYSDPQFVSSVRSTVRSAENSLREAHGLPRVGEGWIAETALFREIQKAFPQAAVVQHGRPSWLGHQHFDIWIPRWRIAVEYHGTQHFEPIEIFGGSTGLAATQERDRRKESLCREHGVTLIVVAKDMPMKTALDAIRKCRASRSSSHYCA